MELLSTKITGNTLTATEWDQVPKEMENVITDMLNASLTNADLTQLGQAISTYVAVGNWYTESNIANVYVCTAVTGESPDQLLAGMVIRFVPGNANTGASTVNVAGLGVKSILHEDGSALVAGDLTTTRDAVCRYDTASGGRFFLTNSSVIDLKYTPTGYISGLNVANHATLNDRLIFGIGEARDSTDSVTMFKTAVMTKRADTVWAAGDGNGGRASAIAYAASEWWHCFMIMTPAGLVDFGYDIDIDAANLLADATGYPYFRRIASWPTSAGSTDFADAFQYGDEFRYETPRYFTDIVAVNTQVQVGELWMPDDTSIRLKGYARILQVAGHPVYYSIADGDSVIALPLSSTAAVAVLSGTGTVMSVALDSVLNASGEFATRKDVASSTTYYYQINGWVDTRGKDS